MLINDKYDVKIISLYVVNKSYCLGKPISNLKLQKLLYYIQAAFLVLKNQVCFDANIEAWGSGPVVPEAYEEFKLYGGLLIPEFKKGGKAPLLYYFKYNIKYEDLKIIEKEDRELIDQIIRIFANCSSTYLTQRSTKEAPWIEAYKTYYKRISNESIYDYFKDKITKE